MKIPTRSHRTVKNLDPGINCLTGDVLVFKIIGAYTHESCGMTHNESKFLGFNIKVHRYFEIYIAKSLIEKNRLKKGKKIFQLELSKCFQKFSSKALFVFLYAIDV